MVGARLVREKRNELTSLLAAHFTRREPVRQIGKYIDALMSDLPDKNCWSLAQHAGDAAPDKMQRLLERAAWNQPAAMRTVRDFAVAGLAAPDGLTVLVLDESGQVKQGDRTAGVKPQYVGCAGPCRERDQLRERHLFHRAGACPGRFPAVDSRRAAGRRLSPLPDGHPGSPAARDQAAARRADAGR